MTPRRAAIAGLAAVAWLVPARPARCAVSLSLPLPDLVNHSDLVVRARVVAVTGAGGGGRPRTALLVRPVEVLAGRLEGRLLDIELPGGEWGGRVEVFPGLPAPQPGETWVFFVRQEEDGRVRLADPVAGAVRVPRDEDGAAGRGAVPGPPREADMAAVRDAVASASTRGRRVQGLRAAGSEVWAPFTLAGSGRFFEPDLEAPVSFLADARGDSRLGIAASLEAVRAAVAAWNAIAGSRLEVALSGTTTDLSSPCVGPHKILFDDPEDLIPPPVHCAGTLALGSFCTAPGDLKILDGAGFARAVRGRVVFADGWGDCPVWTACNIAEIATHELGHALGFGHSSDPAATMFPEPHLDGRCAAVADDDRAAARHLYPDPPPPTILGPVRLPAASVGAAWSWELRAVGGQGRIHWRLEDSDRCAPPAGLELDEEGRMQGVFATPGLFCVRARAADERGAAHVRSFALPVYAEGEQSPSPTVAPPATPTPTGTTPSTATPAAPPCPGDCSGDGRVSVDELVRLVRAFLGEEAGGACGIGRSGPRRRPQVGDLVVAVRHALFGCGMPAPGAADTPVE